MRDADLSITKSSLEERATDALRECILDGHLAQGERLTEQGLARHFKLSPGTVRSALSHLSSEGLVSKRPYAGWEVAQMSRQDIAELFVLREALEGIAAMDAALATAAGTDTAPLVRARDALDAVCVDGGVAAIAEADLHIHRMIVALTANQRLIEHYRLVSQQIRMAIAASNAQLADPGAIAVEHRPLVAAVLSGDPYESERLARAHTRDAAALLLDGVPEARRTT